MASWHPIERPCSVCGGPTRATGDEPICCKTPRCRASRVSAYWRTNAAYRLSGYAQAQRYRLQHGDPTRTERDHRWAERRRELRAAVRARGESVNYYRTKKEAA